MKMSDWETFKSDIEKVKEISSRKKKWTAEEDRELLDHIFQDVERKRKAKGLPPLSNDGSEKEMKDG